MKRISIHFQYWLSFLLIPIVVAFVETRRVYSDLMIVWDVKRQLAAQWARYGKFKEMGDE